MGKIVDLSHHNGDIDWAQASKEIDLAIIRVQYGSRVIDRKYQEYVAGCKQYGIPFGHYAYGHFVSLNDAKVEANDFLNRIDKDAKFLVLDTEDDTVASCGAANVAAASQVFIDTCKAAGWKTGYYISHHLYQSYGLDKVKADFVWIPRYGGEKPDFPCDIWQYSETGRVAGIVGDVDLDQLTGSKPLSYFIGDDFTGHWAEVSIRKALAKGVVSGYDDGTFKPDEPLTRAQLCAVLDRLSLLD